MKLLILGGTVFLGRHIVTEALNKGHEVTLFNRGETNPELFPDVERLKGDRDGHLESLKGRHWDGVIDTCGFVPRVVKQSVDILKGSVDHYTFISTISVYRDFTVKDINEEYPVGKLEDETTEEDTGEAYGPLKALCEKVVMEGFGDKALIIRPGLLVGPYDHSDRFTYWVDRISRGGSILAPGKPDRQVQFIDARDLAAWIINRIEKSDKGIYNATGPEAILTMEEVLRTAKNQGEISSDFIWVSNKFLVDHRVTPYTEMPLWVPDRPEYIGFNKVNNKRAVEAGLRFRSLEVTIKDILRWLKEDKKEHSLKAGLSNEKEEKLLRIWEEEIK